jgi:dUTP pyrophosphatase
MGSSVLNYKETIALLQGMFSHYTAKSYLVIFSIQIIIWYYPITTLLFISSMYLVNTLLEGEGETPIILNACDPDAKIPVRGSSHSAGLDLYCCSEDIVLEPNTRHLISTGLKLVSCPENVYLRIAPRSGLSCKGIDVGAGVVDRDYRGEIKILIINNGKDNFTISKHSRIAQMVCEKILYPNVIVQGLGKDETSQPLVKTRGEGGFGSTKQ